jgi:hypothetical protein
MPFSATACLMRFAASSIGTALATLTIPSFSAEADSATEAKLVRPRTANVVITGQDLNMSTSRAATMRAYRNMAEQELTGNALSLGYR